MNKASHRVQEKMASLTRERDIRPKYKETDDGVKKKLSTSLLSWLILSSSRGK